jgi:hypothetical protein
LRVEPRRTAHVLKLWSVCSMGCAKLASLIDRCIMVVDEYPARRCKTRAGGVRSTRIGVGCQKHRCRSSSEQQY